MKNLFLLFIIPFLLSCNEPKKKESQIYDKKDHPDTLYITEDTKNYYGFDLKFDTLTKEKHIPRNVWVKVHAEGRYTMFHILKHADLFLNSQDSNFQIQRISKHEYKFFINNKYKGYIPDGGPVKGQECLKIFPDIQPNKGYVLSTYWLEKPVKYPERTNVLLMYETVEEVK